MLDFDVAYVHGGTVRYQPGESLLPRHLDDHELVLILEGSATYVRDGVSYQCQKGDALLSQPGVTEVYSWDPHKLTEHAYCHFRPQRVPEDWPATWPVVQPNAPEAFGPLFRLLLEEITLAGPAASSTPTPRLRRLLAALVECFFCGAGSGLSTAVAHRSAAVERALTYLRRCVDETPTQSIRLGDIAVAGGVGEKHLCRLFAEELQLSPMRVLMLMRLELAMSMLRHGNLPVSEVALRCGFSSPFYFSRQFSRVFAQAPSHFRAFIRKGGERPAPLLPADAMPRLRW